MKAKRGFAKWFYLLCIGGLLSGMGLFLFLLGKTDLSPTYQREAIPLSLQTLCSEEYQLPVTVSMEGNTLWIQAQANKLTNQNKAYSEDALNRIKIILKALGRVLLSVDSPPAAYVIQVRETQSLREALFIGMVRDVIQFQYGYLPQGEYSRRRVIESHSGEKTPAFDLIIEDFLSKLIQQEIRQVFEQLASDLDLKDFKMNYSLSKAEFTIDYDIRPLKEASPLLVFNEIKRRVRETLINKYGLKGDRTVKFIDRCEKMEKTYSLTELGSSE